MNALGGNKGVFADLRSLQPGADIRVARADGGTAVFTVERGALYGKDSFPTLEVYGNTAGAELRLITCDGYDPATGLFDPRRRRASRHSSCNGWPEGWH